MTRIADANEVENRIGEDISIHSGTVPPEEWIQVAAPETAKLTPINAKCHIVNAASRVGPTTSLGLTSLSLKYRGKSELPLGFSATHPRVTTTRMQQANLKANRAASGITSDVAT